MTLARWRLDISSVCIFCNFFCALNKLTFDCFPTPLNTSPAGVTLTVTSTCPELTRTSCPIQVLFSALKDV